MPFQPTFNGNARQRAYSALGLHDKANEILRRDLRVADEMDYPLWVKDVIEEASASAQGLVSNSDLSFATEVADGAPAFAVGDKARLSQILVNFIGNAVKFSERGQITLVSEKCTDGIRLAVRDNGPGVPKDQQKKIFRRFEQGDDDVTKKFSGSGLGLAICDELAKKMNGKIGVDNLLTGGAEFWITLPVPDVCRRHEPSPLPMAATG